MAIAYVLAGINHFVHPAMYLRIMPPQLPAPRFLVALSGVFEIIFGLLLLIKPTRRAAATGIILLLLAVFPANFQMMLNYKREGNSLLWLAILRLPIQVFLIWWAWQYTRQTKGQGQMEIEA